MSNVMATKRYKGTKANVEKNIFFETYMEKVAESMSRKNYKIYLIYAPR